MNRWRIGFVTFFLVILLSTVVFRLYQIQLAQTRSFSDQDMDLIQLAEDSQSREIVIDSGRGRILDRNGQDFVGQKGWRLLVFPQTKQQIEQRKAQFQSLAKLLNYPYHSLIKILLKIKHPMILTYPDRRDCLLDTKQKPKVTSLKIPGVFVVYSDGRMLHHGIGQQVIGRVVRQPFIVRELYQDELVKGKYTLQSRVGISGIEAAFETYLHGVEEKIMNYYHTRNGKPLHGAEVKMVKKKEPVSFQPHTVVTTLDKEIQRKVENILLREKIQEGAIVVQDIQSGDILTLASAPFGSTALGDKNPWDHRALMEATPGSIFKLVVALASLEEGIVGPESKYYCQGKWERFHLKDANRKGHGHQTFAQGFADSCNLYFGSLGKRLTGEKIQKYAKSLGLNQKIIWSNQNWKQVPTEHQGMIFAKDSLQKDVGALVQTGIGQRDVKITPIQAANMVTALFHQGRAPHPRIIQEVRRSKDQVVFRFPKKYLSHTKKLKPSTVKAAQQMMRKVMTDGTASSIRGTQWNLAGKTGTAQTGIKGNQYHKWMIGFGPYEQPRYSVAVLVKSLKNPDDEKAKKIFRQVMNVLAEMEKHQKQ